VLKRVGRLDDAWGALIRRVMACRVGRMTTGYLLMRSLLRRNPPEGAGRLALGGLRGAQLLFVG